jgi:hypothetical protein
LRADYRQQTLRLLAPSLLSFGNGIAFDQLRLGMADTILQAGGRLTPTLDTAAPRCAISRPRSCACCGRICRAKAASTPMSS